MTNSFQKKNLQSGQAMILAVLLFLAVSLTIIFGVAEPVLRQGRIVSDLFRSRQSYFLAESGMEDVVYRLKNRIPVSVSGQQIDISGQNASTDITDSGSGQTITTTASWDGHVRKIETKLITGVGASFNYGVQVGNGGLVMSNNSSITGNVYSNGDISGGNGSSISGSAYSANSVGVSTDQSNLTPSTPPNSITFRNTSATQDVAQEFQVSTTAPLNKIQVYIKKNGNPSNATVRVTTDNGGAPSNNTLATGTLSASQVTTSYSLVDVYFSSNPDLSINTNYWLVIDDSSQSSSHYYIIGANNSYASGVAKTGVYGSTWNATGLDIYFSVSLGGLNGTISGVTVGTGSTGDAWAHTVTNTTVSGNLYCQTGTGNNKSCDTSKSDPSQENFPISDGNITAFKDAALSGGTYNGDKSINATSTTLGPIKINGNLTATNNAIITVTGNIWVTGDVTLSNGTQIKLDPSYGSNSGILVSDGKVNISNNTQFNGSGTSGSYLMLVTTSDCPTSSTCNGANAIEVGNNAGAVILNAQKGTIDFSNNAGAKEAVGKTLSLSNGANIVYESGLANVNFASGPSGGWDIQSWKEVQ